jgi:3'(2'), 5'-bisphosphate nucleotidase
MTTNYSDLLDPLENLARDAGERIMTIYAQDFEVTEKADHSPLTEADMASHHCIVSGLARLTPDIPVLSEESQATPFAERRRWERYWLVDPLDGTKEFIKKNGEFTVNIALIERHEPVLGVVYVPARDLGYSGSAEGGAFRRRQGASPEPIQVTASAAAPVRVVGSRSHKSARFNAYLAKLGAHELVSMGSSLKLCLIAEGKADVYPRLGPTSEWDTAAAHAVVLAAGGQVVDPNGEPLRYNVKDSLLNPYFIAYGDGGRDWLQYLPKEKTQE